MDNNRVVLASLGTLFNIDVYIYYDGPQLFSCESLAGQKYLALNVEYDDGVCRWFYMPISSSRLDSVKRGDISLYDAFKKAENGWLWEVTIDSNGLDEAILIRVHDLCDEDLPSKESSLSFVVQSLPERQEDSMLLSQRLKRDVVDISLAEEGVHNSEIGCEHLGSVLLRFQNLVDSMVSGSSGGRGRIPQVIKQKAELKAAGTFAASFGVRLISNSIANLFDQTTVSPALEALMTVMEAKADPDKLTDAIEGMSSRSKSRYRFLLKALNEGNIDFNVDWGSPNKTSRSISLSHNDVQSLLTILEEDGEDVSEILKLTGTLIGVNVERKTFVFRDDSKEQYSGTIDDALLGRVFSVPMDIDVAIEETLEINPLTKEEKVSYRLMSVST